MHFYFCRFKTTINAEIIKSPSFGIQLDESTNISRKSHLMVFCRFPDIEDKKMVKHYLLCQPVEKATAEAIFKKSTSFSKNRGQIGQSAKLQKQMVLQLCKAYRSCG